jgi:hypothetical protein
MINYLLVVNLLASAALLVHSTCVLNRMGYRSNHFWRLGYVVGPEQFSFQESA